MEHEKQMNNPPARRSGINSGIARLREAEVRAREAALAEENDKLRKGMGEVHAMLSAIQTRLLNLRRQIGTDHTSIAAERAAEEHVRQLVAAQKKLRELMGPEHSEIRR